MKFCYQIKIKKYYSYNNNATFKFKYVCKYLFSHVYAQYGDVFKR